MQDTTELRSSFEFVDLFIWTPLQKWSGYSLVKIFVRNLKKQIIEQVNFQGIVEF